MTGILATPLAERSDFASAKAEVRVAVEDFLAAALSRQPDSEVARAAGYAVLGGGHRWRAIAAIAAGRIFCDDPFEMVLPAACGVELAHAASLILDDLPSMDDARVRRGKPCAHHVFPTWAVDMAPVFMVTLAYQMSLDNAAVSAERRVKAALALSHAGLAMIEGQCQDVSQLCLGAGEEEAWLIERYRLKSGALYGAATLMGGVLCGADDTQAERLHAAGLHLGLAYQYLDDVADVVAGIEQVGKESGMDAQKRTAIDLFGVEGARTRSNAYQAKALAALDGFGPRADWLRTLVTEASWKAS